MVDPVWLAVPLGEVARMHGVSPGALRRRIQFRARTAVNPRLVDFDGHRFRKRDGRWHPFIREPWHQDERLREWLSIEEAAARCQMRPGTLRRQIERQSRLVDGLRVASPRGVFSCKFGDTWRVCLDTDSGAPNA